MIHQNSYHRANENVEESKNILISMLEELLRKEAAHIKKKKLADKYERKLEI